MLKQRLITAAVLVPLIMLVIFKAPTEGLAIFLALIVLAAAWEWGRMLELVVTPRALFVAIIGIAMLIGFFVILPKAQLFTPMMGFATLLWLVLIVAVVSAQRSGMLKKGLSRQQYLPLGFLLFLLAWLSAVYLHQVEDNGPALLFYVMVLVAIVDAGAYFAGRQWGKHKLANHISPGKTWQGFYGAVLVGVLVALIGAWYFDYSATQFVIFVLISMIVIIFSVFGDLFESWIKRRAGVKDSGGILPGHGGALDRIDSLLAALPVTAFGLSFSGII